MARSGRAAAQGAPPPAVLCTVVARFLDHPTSPAGWDPISLPQHFTPQQQARFMTALHNAVTVGPSAAPMRPDPADPRDPVPVAVAAAAAAVREARQGVEYPPDSPGGPGPCLELGYPAHAISRRRLKRHGIKAMWWGVLHLDRYLDDEPCFEVEGEGFMTKSAFEQAGNGSHLARWYRSIHAMVPDLQPLEAWLKKRGLEVKRGCTRVGQGARAGQAGRKGSAAATDKEAGGSRSGRGGSGSGSGSDSSSSSGSGEGAKGRGRGRKRPAAAAARTPASARSQRSGGGGGGAGAAAGVLELPVGAAAAAAAHTRPRVELAAAPWPLRAGQLLAPALRSPGRAAAVAAAALEVPLDPGGMGATAGALAALSRAAPPGGLAVGPVRGAGAAALRSAVRAEGAAGAVAALEALEAEALAALQGTSGLQVRASWGQLPAVRGGGVPKRDAWMGAAWGSAAAGRCGGPEGQHELQLQQLDPMMGAAWPRGRVPVAPVQLPVAPVQLPVAPVQVPGGGHRSPPGARARCAQAHDHWEDVPHGAVSDGDRQYVSYGSVTGGQPVGHPRPAASPPAERLAIDAGAVHGEVEFNGVRYRVLYEDVLPRAPPPARPVPEAGHPRWVRPRPACTASGGGAVSAGGLLVAEEEEEEVGRRGELQEGASEAGGGAGRRGRGSDAGASDWEAASPRRAGGVEAGGGDWPCAQQLSEAELLKQLRHLQQQLKEVVRDAGGVYAEEGAAGAGLGGSASGADPHDCSRDSSLRALKRQRPDVDEQLHLDEQLRLDEQFAQGEPWAKAEQEGREEQAAGWGCGGGGGGRQPERPADPVECNLPRAASGGAACHDGRPRSAPRDGPPHAGGSGRAAAGADKDANKDESDPWGVLANALRHALAEGTVPRLPAALSSGAAAAASSEGASVARGGSRGPRADPWEGAGRAGRPGDSSSSAGSDRSDVRRRSPDGVRLELAQQYVPVPGPFPAGGAAGAGLRVAGGRGVGGEQAQLLQRVSLDGRRVVVLPPPAARRDGAYAAATGGAAQAAGVAVLGGQGPPRRLPAPTYLPARHDAAAAPSQPRPLADAAGSRQRYTDAEYGDDGQYEYEYDGEYGSFGAGGTPAGRGGGSIWAPLPEAPRAGEQAARVRVIDTAAAAAFAPFDEAPYERRQSMDVGAEMGVGAGAGGQRGVLRPARLGATHDRYDGYAVMRLVGEQLAAAGTYGQPAAHEYDI